MSRAEILQDISKIAGESGISQEKISSIKLIAVSKYATSEQIKNLYNQGQRDFAENIVQNALTKQDELKKDNINNIIWHFIAPVQSNKTKNIANNFSWVHSLSRIKIAQRLNSARLSSLPPLNICLQLNLDGDENKSGILVEDITDISEIMDIANQILEMPNLRLRGLMTLPKKLDDKELSLKHAKKVFYKCNQIFNLIKNNINKDYFDTLSMGMSEDYSQAILCGSNMVRVGRKLFGY